MEKNVKIAEKYGSWEAYREGKKNFVIYKEDEKYNFFLKGKDKGPEVLGIFKLGTFRGVKKGFGGDCLFNVVNTILGVQKKNGGKIHYCSMTLEGDRQKIYNLVRKGARVIDIEWPTSLLFKYHKRLIKWREFIMKKYFIDEIVIHIPLLEYVYYFNQIEKVLNDQIMKPYFEELHIDLTVFVDKLKQEYIAVFGNKVRFVDPFDGKNPIASYMLPYKKPETVGLKKGEFICIEDAHEYPLYAEDKDGFQGTGIIYTILDKEGRPYKKEPTSSKKYRVREPIGLYWFLRGL